MAKVIKVDGLVEMRVRKRKAEEEKEVVEVLSKEPCDWCIEWDDVCMR